MASIAAVFVVLLAGIGVATWMAIRASRAEAEARAVSQFLQNDLLAQAGASTQAAPNAKPDPHLEVRTALDRAAARIAGKFHRQPLVEAALRETIGTAYEDLGLYPEAQRQFERALSIYRSTQGETRPETVHAMDNLGVLYSYESNYPPAEALLTKTLAIGERLWGKQAPETLGLMSDLGDAYSRAGKYNQAEALLLKALDIRRVLGPENDRTLVTLNNLALADLNLGRFADSEKLFNDVLALRRRVSGPEHPDTLLAMRNLGSVYLSEGRSRRPMRFSPARWNRCGESWARSMTGRSPRCSILVSFIFARAGWKRLKRCSGRPRKFAAVCLVPKRL